MKSKESQKKINPEILPILFIITLLPFIMRAEIVKTGLENMPWLPYIYAERGDIFLLWKSRIFVVMAVIMVILLFDYFVIKNRKWTKSRCWFFLLGYELMAVLSTVLSDNSYYGIHGMPEHFESVFVLLAYGITAYYAYCVIEKQEDVRLVCFCLTAAVFVQGIIGVSQIFGSDLMQTEIVKKIIAGSNLSDSLQFFFTNEQYQRVSTTLYNPNYAGVYFAMFLPIGISLYSATDRTQKKLRVFLVMTTFLSLLCMIGTGSKSAISAVLIMGVLSFLYLSRMNKKHLKYGLIAAVFFLAVFLLYDWMLETHTLERFKDAFYLSDQENLLQRIETEQEWVSLEYYGHNIRFFYKESEDGMIPVFWDENGKEIPWYYDKESQSCRLEDSDFKDIRFRCFKNNGIPFITLTYKGIDWIFTDDTQDRSYRYINVWSREDEIKTAESVFFRGKEGIFTNRGYIWSRTIPLLKKYWFIGSGADTFMLVFPQNDYAAKAAFGYEFLIEILTKPHSMYLQTGVQTGCLSLLCFLLFLGCYLWKESVFLFKAEKPDAGSFKTLRMGIFSAILIYMIMGMTNDSMIVTAPVFWVILGIGIKLQVL